MLAATLLVLSAGVVFFEAACRKLLKQLFVQEYFHPVAEANCLEFPSLQKVIANPSRPTEYPQLTSALRHDFLQLTYLLKHTADSDRCYTNADLCLILYFHFGYVAFAARHWLGLAERDTVMNLLAVLKHFANVVGERAGKEPSTNARPAVNSPVGCGRPVEDNLVPALLPDGLRHK